MRFGKIFGALCQRIKWKTKILFLKIRFGKKILIHWNDRIASTVKFRINGDGKIELGEQIELRENVIINVSDGGHVFIGDRVFINDGCNINARKSVYIGNDTMFGQGVKIYDHDHDYRSKDIKTHFICTPIIIGEQNWLGSNAIILRHGSIGKKCVIAAGTIVKEPLPDNVLYYEKKSFGMKKIGLTEDGR